jgi:hypothetical protein
MIDISMLFEINKDNAGVAALKLESKDIGFLVGLLEEKDDKIRYPALLLLQSRSVTNNDVYPFWDIFRSKLKSDNSYQRSIGMMLIAENARWDKDNKLDAMIEEYFALFHDDKPITIRQSIQALSSILPFKSSLVGQIATALMAIDIFTIKETMRKLVLADILEVLAAARKLQANDEIDSYIMNALSGGLLDKKSKSKIQALL